jgi:hypothetical protein
MRRRIAVLVLGAAFGLARAAAPLPASEPLRLSVYATAGDVLAHLATEPGRNQARRALGSLGVTRLFLEGRRGDTVVSPATLRELRDWFQARGVACAGGIATVPGAVFGQRQTGGLDWLNWESARTRRDVASFFSTNAAVFGELIVDDFYCTGDTSAEGERARGARSWGEYRRDLLVGLLDPLLFEPARAARPDARLIIKFPQWYDRFHLFGYDPPRMAAPFDRVWVGTEVRDPATRRMGYVQPTEGYMNFRWLASVAGEKTVGAWFDHIECSAQGFLDQAVQSVLAGARELTLFHLGDVVAGHPGDALLAQRLPELQSLAARVRDRGRRGLVFYKAPGSEAGDNTYLADYLGMLGLPILPAAQFPSDQSAVFLPAQAAADPGIEAQLRRHLDRGGWAVVTPAFLRRVPGAASQAGVWIAADPVPQAAAAVDWRGQIHRLDRPLDIDGGLAARDGEVRASAIVAEVPVPFLTAKAAGAGRILVLNVRTFSELDFRAAGEWLLAPKLLGLPVLAEGLIDSLRAELLPEPALRLAGPAGVALCAFDGAAAVCSFLDRAVRVRWNGRMIDLGPHDWRWQPEPAE